MVLMNVSEGERRRAFLAAWNKRKGSDATYGALLHALLKTGCQEDAVMERASYSNDSILLQLFLCTFCSLLSHVATYIAWFFFSFHPCQTKIQPWGLIIFALHTIMVLFPDCPSHTPFSWGPARHNNNNCAC